MATIDLTFEGETPDAVSLLTLTRADTGGTVAGVTLPAALTEDTDGSWVYTFAEPAEGLHYDYTYRVTWSDGSTSDAAGTITGAAETTYATDADVENAYGRDNVTAWADLNDNGDVEEVAARKAWARGQAKILIDEALAGAALTVPATDESFRFYASLAGIEAELAGVLLYQSRGIYDQQRQAGDADGAMQGHYDRALARLGALTAAAGTFQFVDIRRGSVTDEYSSN